MFCDAFSAITKWILGKQILQYECQNAIFFPSKQYRKDQHSLLFILAYILEIFWK